MKCGVIVFPGSNCDHDCYHLLKHTLKQKVDFIWHKESFDSSYDLIVLPGGFSYGDYLRAGAIARFSPVMSSVKEYAASGGLVLGICNGFQILVEAGLLPGVLMRNSGLKFRCQEVTLRVENNQTVFTSLYGHGSVVNIPIAHADGNYYADPDTLKKMKENKQIVFRYSSADGKITGESNPNGSLENIAGVCNENGNVLGMMPHPERVWGPTMKNDDGLLLFKSLLAGEKAGSCQAACPCSA